MLSTSAPFLIAIGASAFIALFAWQVRSLSAGGALFALLVGAIALRANYGIGIYLIAWFALATMLSKIEKAKKARRVVEIVEKGSQRDAGQVLANGGVFALLILLFIIFAPQCDPFGGCERILVAAAASLAAAGADTWATEVGTLLGGTPWSLRSASRVPAGTSGAITLAGTAAMIAGGITFALLSLALGMVTGVQGVVAVAVGGITGAFADTLLGAWLQERRWCPRCTTETEQRVHRCATPTVHHRGVSGLNNDVVNFACTFVGATAALLLVLS